MMSNVLSMNCLIKPVHMSIIVKIVN